MTHNELRHKFLKFFEKKGHKIVPSSPVIPYDDPTLMFTNAGMNQFKEVLLGNETRSYKRATSVQKCIRVSGKHNDFEIVGFDGYHHTFFEMLGNWSFGDYYKKEAIEFAWEFLTQVLGFNPDHLAVSIYKDDEESYDIWKNIIKLPEEKIIRLGDIEKGDEENFWSMGETGPCGPCTEIYFNPRPEIPVKLTSKGYPDYFIELWNLVFMEFNRNEKGELKPLKMKSVDTGMGFERLYAIIHNKESNYHTDLFMPIIRKIEELTGKSYSDKENEVSFQVIADHIRAISFAIADGGVFSNEGRGYVLRKILRRAERHSQKLGAESPILYKLVDTLTEIMGDFYPELKEKQEIIKKFVQKEEEKFRETLQTGLNKITVIIEQIKKEGKKIIEGKDVFMLYDTYGFPPDITKEIAREHGLNIDERGFNVLMEKQREKGRASWNGSKKFFNEEKMLELLKELPGTKFTGYERLKEKSKILAIIKGEEKAEELREGEEGGILLEITPFYGESGGQIGDRGFLKGNESIFKVEDTQKYGNRYIIHWGKVEKGVLNTQDEVEAEVDEERRWNTAKNHTATHLLQAGLRKVLGPHITQAGSYVAPDRLRFDFRHFHALTSDELNKIEECVNYWIQKNYRVEKFYTEKEKAIKMGAMAIFGEKYGETVRVVKIDDVSMELCGGTHLDYTGEIGLFVILSESSIASGIRRIEALTGKEAVKYMQQIKETINKISKKLKVPQQEIINKIESIQKENKELTRKLSQMKGISYDDIVTELINKSEKIKDTTVIIKEFKNESKEFLNKLADLLEKKIKNGAILFINIQENKVSLLVCITKELVEKGFDAVKIINEIAVNVGGRGGGRKDRAQAGGKELTGIEKLKQSFKEIFNK